MINTTHNHVLGDDALKQILAQLRNLPAENEIVEFKEVTSGNYDFNKLGRYFSAISNEANLHNKDCGWLIFGIRDKDKAIVGSNFRPNRHNLDKLKGEIAQKTTNRITFIEIYELAFPEGRVVMFQIPPAPKGFPVAWEGHYYGRDGEEQSPLNIEKIERIRKQDLREDWSAGILREATLDDLDEAALAIARRNYREKNSHIAHEIDQWDTLTFLNKAKITIKGQITRTAILLLGKPEAEYLLAPADPKIRWILKNKDNQERDWQIFTIPFVLSVDAIYGKIRNLMYRYLPHGTLFPDEILRYEPFTIREAINNCIAHQDYIVGGRINVVEREDDELIFTNQGRFLPPSVETVVNEDAPQEQYYRNKFLLDAMAALKMVDTIGSGIRKMFEFQRQRFFPLPEYTLSNARVEVRITGKVLDLEFARILALNPGLSLHEIMMLDKVQKQKNLNDIECKYLKRNGLVEGRKPNFYLSAKVVKPLTDDLKAQYVRQKGFDDEYYKKIIIEYITQFGSADRQAIEKLILDKLPEILSHSQRKSKISNLITSLRKDMVINNQGSATKPNWILYK